MSKAFSRRALLGMAAGGVGGGLAWSSALVYTQQVHSPRIDIIGDDESQFALFDTGHHRVLFALGPASPWLAGHLASLFGPFRQSLDVCIGTDAAFSILRGQRSSSIDASLWLGVPDEDEPRSPRSDRAVTHPTLIRLSSGVTVDIDPNPTRGAGWIATISRGSIVIGLSARLESLVSVDRPLTAGIAPGGTISLLQRRNATFTLVSNGPTFEGFPATLPIVRTFADEPARLGVALDSLSLPSWTELPAS